MIRKQPMALTTAHFFSLLKAPHTITAQQYKSLSALLQAYPYFQLGHALMAKVSGMTPGKSDPLPLQRAAIYATNRHHLKKLLDSDVLWQEALSKQLAIELQGVSPTPVDVAQGSMVFPTSKKNLAQWQLIDAFMEKSKPWPKKNQEESEKSTTQQDLSQINPSLKNYLITENFAQVLVAQKKISQAITIYKALMVRFPKKNRYFSNIINHLKQ